MLGHLPEALKLHEETLALRSASLGPGHRDTLMSMLNVSNDYFRLGRYADAVKLGERTLAYVPDESRAGRRRYALGYEYPRSLLPGAKSLWRRVRSSSKLWQCKGTS